MQTVKIIFLFLFIFFFKNVNADDENKIVIKVNNKIISSYEVKNKINTELILRNLEINQTNINKMKNLAIQSLIDFRVKENEVEKYTSIKLNNIDISGQLKSISSGNINGLKQKFKNYNLNYNIFIKELKLQSAWQNVIFTLFKDKIKIDEDEILKELNNIKNKTSKNKTYDLSEIEISFKDEKEKNEKLNKIKKSINELGFTQTVSIFSETLSATNKGRIGFVNEKILSQQIYNKLKDLNPGDISEPIIQLNKITFLKINEIKFVEDKNFDIDLIKKNLINKKKNDLLKLYSRSHLSKLKNTSFIEFK